MLKKRIKKWLLGTDLIQEYICVGMETFTEIFKIVLSFPTNSTSIDVSKTHVFLGYKPLIVGISFNKCEQGYGALASSGEVCLSFNSSPFKEEIQKNKFKLDKKNIAQLFLKKIIEKDFDDTSFFIYQGVKGKHQFLSPFHQFTNQLLNSLKRKGSNNIGLPGNLYEQVRIAYSVPRIISVISLGSGNQYNMFPTDLHGSINNDLYVSSLRHEGEACKQVMEIKRITISTVSIDSFRDTYALGKNHMHPLKPLEAFKINAIQSEQFNYPLPKEILSYKEMELIDTIDIGIHRLLFYKIINNKVLNRESSTLSHIHQYCQVWREKQGIKTEVLMR